MLETLALGELETEMTTLQAVETGTVEQASSPATINATEAAVAPSSTDPSKETSAAFDAGSHQSQSAMSGYQQQSWQTSWDSLLADSSDNNRENKNRTNKS